MRCPGGPETKWAFHGWRGASVRGASGMSACGAATGRAGDEQGPRGGARRTVLGVELAPGRVETGGTSRIYEEHASKHVHPTDAGAHDRAYAGFVRAWSLRTLEAILAPGPKDESASSMLQSIGRIHSEHASEHVGSMHSEQCFKACWLDPQRTCFKACWPRPTANMLQSMLARPTTNMLQRMFN